MDECKDLSGLFYLLPFQKGYLVNWDTQRQVWDYLFSNLKLTPKDLNLIFTEPPFNFPSIQESLHEVFFEEYQFSSILISSPTTLSAAYQLHEVPDRPCCLVVDTGYSFTHVVPYFKGKVLRDSIRRIDVGGKVLTNHLKEIVSYRQLNVLDETYVLNQVKEEICFVSQNLYADMEIARKKDASNTILREYVLPDFTSVKKGYIRELGSKSGVEEQVLKLANERFAVPEILFYPSDIGLNQMGIAEAIVHSISTTPKPMHAHLYHNILLTGGSTLFPGFYDRVFKEVRKLAPDIHDVHMSHSKQPHFTPWFGGKTIMAKGVVGLDDLQPVTQSEYKEYGHMLCHKRFRDNQILSMSSSE